MSAAIPLDETVLVAGQIAPAEVPDLAAQGVTLLINNRPDGEQPGQPKAAAIEAAARAAGIGYRHIPVAGGFSPAQVEAMAQALEAAPGKALAFCRSGTRSTHLWALARASRGADGEQLIAQARAAGYDISALRAYLGR